MTNEIRTRRLIVTLPGTAAEEIAIAAQDLEELTRIRWGGDIAATVEVVRDEHLTIQDEVKVGAFDVIDGSRDRVSLIRAATDGLLMLLTKDEAQQLAGQLLRAADEIEEA